MNCAVAVAAAGISWRCAAAHPTRRAGIDGGRATHNSSSSSSSGESEEGVGGGTYSSTCRNISASRWAHTFLIPVGFTIGQPWNHESQITCTLALPVTNESFLSNLLRPGKLASACPQSRESDDGCGPA